MSITTENLVEVSGAKAGQRAILKDGKAILVGMGGITGSSGEPEAPTMDLSFITATADKILTGYTGADQQGSEVPGTMPISTVTETSEKVTVTKGYLEDNKEFAVSSGGGSMEIYKCAAVHEASTGNGYIVEGAGTTEVNGTYTFSEATGYYDVYINENGYMLWAMYESGAINYLEFHGTSSDMCYYIFPVSNDVIGTGDVLDGQTPAPTVRKAEPSEASWDGYKYSIETGEFAEELTEGLEYKYIPPVVGKCYSKDAFILCDFPYLGDYLYHPSVTTIGDLSVWGTQPQFGTWKGVPCMIFDGTGAFYKTFDSLISEDFTFSCFWYMLEGSSQMISAIGKWRNRNSMEFLYDGEYIKFYCDGAYGSEKFVNGNYYNSWHSMTVTYSSSKFKMYVDGVNVGERSGAHNLSPIVALGTIVAQSGTSSRDGYMTGYIGDFSIWGRALSETEVLMKHNEMMTLVTE